MKRLFLTLMTFVLALTCANASLAAPSARRVAILVGANDPPPGRAPLRYAHEDARRMADVLTRVGGFAPADVHVLLEPSHPEIDRVIADAAQSVKDAGGDAVFLFYYSGHSDGQSVYPKGSPLSVQDLRARIAGVGARVTVGILDTC
jgi:Caspase domain